MKDEVLTDPRLYFWLRSGRGLKSSQDLLHYLPEISDEEFSFHVNEHKNDFSQWIQDVFGDKELARFLRDAQTPKEMLDLFVNYYHGGDTNTPSEQPQDLLSKITSNEEIKEVPGLHSEKLDPDELAAHNDALSERFDAATKRLTEKTQPAVSESMEKRIEILRERENELRQAISEARKAGYDPFIADIVLRQFLPRLELARASEEEQDFQLVEDTLKQAKDELEEARSIEPINVKKEVEALAQ